MNCPRGTSLLLKEEGDGAVVVRLAHLCCLWGVGRGSAAMAKGAPHRQPIEVATPPAPTLFPSLSLALPSITSRQGGVR